MKLSAGSAFSTLWALEGCGRASVPSVEGQLPADVSPEPLPELGAGVSSSVTNSARTATLRIAFANVPPQLDPATMSANAAIQACFATYDGLVWVDNELTVQPALAERWEASADLLSWTFTLRQDVEFHHGTPLTAQDVVYTFERLLDPAIGSPLRSVLSFVASVEAIDDGSPTGAVRFTLNLANADLPLLCGAPQALIVARDYDPLLLAQVPSGTGPFRVAEAIPGQQLTLLRNDRYWAADTLALQELHHIYLPPFAERAAALNAGEVDLLSDISSEEAAQLAVNEEINILESPSGAYLTVIMQATETPFDDPLVRQALKLCLDRSAVQTAILGGRGEIGVDQPVASINPFHAQLPAQPHDIAQARQLLSDAGYPDGLQLDLITATLDPGMVELAYFVQEMAAPAGFVIRATEVPADVYWSSYWTKVPFHIGSWNFRPSIDETLSIAYHSKSLWNEGKWFSTDLDALLDGARSEPDPDRRKALYEQAQQLIKEEGAVIIPFFRPVLTAIHKSVTGFTPHPAGWINVSGVQIVEST